jgi:hypothetical protein
MMWYATKYDDDSLGLKHLPTLPEHLSSPPVLSGARVTRSLALYVCFVDSCLSLCTFSISHCVVCSSSIYGLWLLLKSVLWVQTFPLNEMMWYATKYDDDSLGLKHHTEPNNGHDVKFIVENTQWTLCQHYFTLWSVLLYLFKITFRITLLILARVTRSLALYVCFVDSCLSLCTFSIGHCVVCSSSIYGFWLLLLVSRRVFGCARNRKSKAYF